MAIFLDRLRNRFIVSKVAGEKYGDQWIEHPTGTGPYKFVSFQRGGNLVFTRNDDYWGGKAAIKEIVFRKVIEDGARLAALESGQTDFINDVPVHEVARLERHPRVRVDKIEGLEMYFLMMNVAYKPFDNKLVRQAVNYSVDATALIKNIFDGLGYPTPGPVGAQVVGTDPKPKRYPYNPQKAKELWPRPATPTAATCSSTIPPAATRKIGKSAKSSPRRWSKAVSRRTHFAGMGAVLGPRRSQRRQAAFLL